jgi:hypothetical protein
MGLKAETFSAGFRNLKRKKRKSNHVVLVLGDLIRFYARHFRIRMLARSHQRSVKTTLSSVYVFVVLKNFCMTTQVSTCHLEVISGTLAIAIKTHYTSFQLKNLNFK